MCLPVRLEVSNWSSDRALVVPESKVPALSSTLVHFDTVESDCTKVSAVAVRFAEGSMTMGRDTFGSPRNAMSGRSSMTAPEGVSTRV